MEWWLKMFIISICALQGIYLFVTRNRSPSSPSPPPPLYEFPEVITFRRDEIVDFDAIIKEYESYFIPNSSLNLFKEEDLDIYRKDILNPSTRFFPEYRNIEAEESSMDYDIDKQFINTSQIPLWIRYPGVFMKTNLRYTENPIFRKFQQTHGIYLSGFFYYPPGGFREWHTNVNDTKMWHMYYVRAFEKEDPGVAPGPQENASRATPGLAQGVEGSNGIEGIAKPRGGDFFRNFNGHGLGSFFSYYSNRDFRFRRIEDPEEGFNLFDLRDGSKPFWHSVLSLDRHRFSIGFLLTDEMAQKLLIKKRKIH